MRIVKLLISAVVILAVFFISNIGSAADDPWPVPQWQDQAFRMRILQAVLGNFHLIAKEETEISGGPLTAPLLALTFEFVNDDPKRKIDLPSDFSFRLNDEFGNEYRQVSATSSPYPLEIPGDIVSTSVYPDSVYRRTIFFEAPVLKSQNLTLTVGAMNIDVPGPVVLKIARSQMRDLTPVPPLRSPQEADLDLIGPPEGTAVHPGSVVHVGLKFPTDIKRPQGVYVIAPNYVLEDNGTTYQYDIRIPKDQPEGPFVVVLMARWDQSEEIVLSKAVALTVTDQKKNDIEAEGPKYTTD